MADFNIKQGDTAPAIEATLEDENGSAVDLTGASVQFHMRSQGGSTAIIDASATISDAPTGKVKYQWSTGDTDSTGSFEAEFEVTFGDGKIETFPNTTNITIEITEQIA